jgi:hypothetical protein
VTDMTQTMTELLLGWAPLIVALAVFLFFSRMSGAQARAPSGRTMIELYELQLEEVRRNTATLERIAQALEQRHG